MKLEQLEVVVRLKGRSMHRANAPSTSVAEHYRINVYLPLVDALLSQLNDRFDKVGKLAWRLGVFIPKYAQQYASEDLDTVHQAYEVSSMIVFLQQFIQRYQLIHTNYNQNAYEPIFSSGSCSAVSEN